jgi:BirA family transcriptional regulator, biotin operon repressor / biotin---[acetyl-CoA-carboxylase] ligase
MMMTPRDVWHLETARIGRRVLLFDEVDSTNSVAADLAAEPDSDGIVVLADHQTAGRGRNGHIWQSRPGRALLMSVLLFPPDELKRASILTAWAAVSVGGAIYELTGIQAKIKWPNDLLIGGKKVCGILIEQGICKAVHRTVVGIGLNLNQTRDEFDEAALPDAASLAIVSNAPIDHDAAARALISHLDDEYARLLAGERVAVEADWKWRMGLIGRQVNVERNGSPSITGRIREMSFDRLELKLPDGVIVNIVPETVTQIRELKR